MLLSSTRHFEGYSFFNQVYFIIRRDNETSYNKIKFVYHLKRSFVYLGYVSLLMSVH